MTKWVVLEEGIFKNAFLFVVQGFGGREGGLTVVLDHFSKNDKEKDGGKGKSGNAELQSLID